MQRAAMIAVALLITLALMLPAANAQPNLVRNGSFTNGTADWTHFDPAHLMFTITGATQEATLNVLRVVINPNLQLYQQPIALIRNNFYRLRFKARSTNGDNMYVCLIKHGAPYTQYIDNPEINLTPAMTQYDFCFRAYGLPTATVNDARLRFFIDWRVTSLPVTYYIDDVELFDLGATCVPCDLPNITGQPQPVTVTLPGRATFNVTAVNAVSYQWQKNGANISGATNPAYTTPDITTSNCADFHNSVYRCLVTNPCGTVTSNGAVLTTNPVCPPVQPCPCPGNLVQNACFDNGVNGWFIYNPSNMGGAVTGGVASITINRMGDGNLQLSQRGLNLVGGQCYEVSFKGASSNGRDVHVALIKDVSPFTQYWAAQVNLTPGPLQAFTYRFRAIANDNNVRLRFLFGWLAAPGEVYSIDEACVKQVLCKPGEEMSEVPTTYALEQNFPNPFNPTTNITFSVPKAGHVSVKVFDVLGREVATVINGVRAAGTYTEVFDASTLSSGIYFYRLEAGNTLLTRKMLIMK